MWCLWAFCQIISIFLFQVLMILDTHYARGGNVCPASLPLKSSPWQVQKGVRAQYVLLRWIATVPSWLRTHDSVLAIIASTSVRPPSPAACIFSFGTISALYTQSANAKLPLSCCQCSSALCVFGSVIGRNEQEIEHICSASPPWTQQQAASSLMHNLHL